MKGILKKTIMGIGAVLGLLVVAAFVIPLVVDVDKYRPQIVEAVNQKINGKLQLGKLSLTLWGRIRVEVMGVQLMDPSQQKVVEVNHAFFDVPFSSILNGSPSVVFKMEKPVVRVIKNQAGKFNFMSLMKPAMKTSSQSGSQPDSSATQASSQIALPAIVVNSILEVEFDHANVSYKDEATNLSTEVKDLNVALHDISLSRTTGIEIWADLNTQYGKLMNIRGPFRVTGKLNPKVVNQRVQQVGLTTLVDFDQIEVTMPGIFEKKAGDLAHADISIQASEKEVQIEHLDVKFFNVELNSSGKISNAETPVGLPAPAPQVEFSLSSNPIEFKSWGQWIPSLKQYELGGTASLEAQLKGPSDKLEYQALLKLVGLTAKSPKLKTQPQFDGQIKVTTNQIDDLSITMKAPGNDVRIQGKVSFFKQPQAVFEVSSAAGMDLDQLIEFPKTTTNSTVVPDPASSATPAGVALADYDALLAPLRNSSIAQVAQAKVTFRLPLLKSYNVKMTDLNGSMTLRDLVASLDQFTMKLLGSSVQATGSVQLKPEIPTYQFNAQVVRLDIKEAMASQSQFFLKLFKDTVVGKASFEMNGEGKSFNPVPAMEQFKAKGKFKVEQASLSTIDVSKLAVEALNKVVDRVAEKFPPLKDKKMSALVERVVDFEYISSDFSVGDSLFKAPNFLAKSPVNQGLDLKGSVQVGIKDRSLKALWELSDPYNLTHARDLSVEHEGIKVEHLLVEGIQPIHFMVHVNCNLMSPCFSYKEVPEYFATVALNNVGNAVKSRVKAEVQKKVDALIQKVPQVAPPQVQQKIEDIGKKLFGR